MPIIENLHALRANINTVTAAGGSVTAEHERIDTRWQDFMNRDKTAAARLADAIIGTEPAEQVNLLAGLALAEQTGTVQVAAVNEAVAAQVFPALRLEYNKVAAANYDALREAFNTTAKEFTAACNTVDPDAEPAELMDATDAHRKAWTTAAYLAPKLTAQIPALITAAKLAGAIITGNDDQLPLTANPGDQHRRRIWEAWDTTEGRAGKWAALIKAGATIEARPLEQFKSYRRPADMETRYEQGAWGYGPVAVDPGDKDYKPLTTDGKTVVAR